MEIFDFWCNDRESNDPYGTEFKVRVCSNGEDNYGESGEEFVGTGFWTCGIEEVRTFVDQLDKMNQFQEKHAEIEDVSYGGRLCFDLDRMGPFEDGLRECLTG